MKDECGDVMQIQGMPSKQSLQATTCGTSKRTHFQEDRAGFRRDEYGGELLSAICIASACGGEDGDPRWHIGAVGISSKGRATPSRC